MDFYGYENGRVNDVACAGCVANVQPEMIVVRHAASPLEPVVFCVIFGVATRPSATTTNETWIAPWIGFSCSAVSRQCSKSGPARLAASSTSFASACDISYGSTGAGGAGFFAATCCGGGGGVGNGAGGVG